MLRYYVLYTIMTDDCSILLVVRFVNDLQLIEMTLQSTESNLTVVELMLVRFRIIIIIITGIEKRH